MRRSLIPPHCRIYLPRNRVYRFDCSLFDQSTKLTMIGTPYLSINLEKLRLNDFDIVTAWLDYHRNDSVRMKHTYDRTRIRVRRWDREFLGSLTKGEAERVMTIAMIMGFDRLQTFLRIVFDQP